MCVWLSLKMADKDNYDKSVDNIEEQIRKLREEKEELERRNREIQQQEHRSLLVKDSISAKRATTTLGSGSSSNRESNRNFGDLPDNLSASLVESQSRIRSLQNILTASKDGSSNMLEDSRVDSQRSSDDADDDVMSPEHKQALRINRDVLVENMTPDDIFNDLISKHILTSADVSRIKDRSTIEAVNEELLNVLTRRSDRAFHVFVASLRRTLQGWLANRIDPALQQKNKRKRRTGEIDVNLSCEQIVPVNKKRHICTVKEVEEQVLTIAKVAFSHIRRRDGTSAAFEQFKKELKQTNEVIMETMETLNALKSLCQHGEITDLTEGSVCFTICCSSLASCQALWAAYESGTLLQTCQRGLVTPILLQTCKAKQIHLCVRISRLEYLTCALELAIKERKNLLKGKQTKQTNKVCGDQDENTPGELTNVFLHNKGQAFKEISVNTMQQSHLTSAKNFVNGHTRLMNVSAAQIIPELPVRCISPEHNLSSRHHVGHCTTVRKQSMPNEIWLRSRGKDVPLSHNCVLRQTFLPDCSASSCHFQFTTGCKENIIRARQEDVCPYNLRYRFLNRKDNSI